MGITVSLVIDVYGNLIKSQLDIEYLLVISYVAMVMECVGFFYAEERVELQNLLNTASCLLSVSNIVMVSCRHCLPYMIRTHLPPSLSPPTHTYTHTHT